MNARARVFADPRPALLGLLALAAFAAIVVAWAANPMAGSLAPAEGLNGPSLGMPVPGSTAPDVEVFESAG